MKSGNKNESLCNLDVDQRRKAWAIQGVEEGRRRPVATSETAAYRA
jgi:hypothetical protein